MSDHQPAPDDGAPGGHDGSHGASGHAAARTGGAAGAGDAQGHDDMGLGPIDWTAWIVGLAGVAAGALTAVCFALATGYVG